jgi:4-carboxymuconolactone decarboxylase
VSADHAIAAGIGAPGRHASPHPNDATGNGTAPPEAPEPAIVSPLDVPTQALVRLAAILAVGDEPAVRAALAGALRLVPALWVEELILQSYLFAGFPRALNAMREWRRLSRRPAPLDDPGAHLARTPEEWERVGEATCAAVYGRFYERLRPNIAALHPALDGWMITEGYGKVLSRPGLDLVRRELCIVAVCAAARQDRQLHSHLHGALNVGAPPTPSPTRSRRCATCSRRPITRAPCTSGRTCAPPSPTFAPHATPPRPSARCFLAPLHRCSSISSPCASRPEPAAPAPAPSAVRSSCPWAGPTAATGAAAAT